ncbi:MAG: ribonuclease Z [Mycobacterium sp.]
MIEIVLTGTGSPMVDPNRAGPSTIVRAGESIFLADCGRGVLMRAAAAGVGAADLTAVLLTHLHSDHITDLSDVITTRWITSLVRAPLPIIGPPGTKAVVEATLAALAPDISYRIGHHADITAPPEVMVMEYTAGQVWDDGVVRIIAAATDHRPVEPTIAFRIEYDGASVVLAGDSVPCATLDALASGADALVHTAIRKDLIEQVPVQRLTDILDYHSSVQQAAATAARAGVQTLVLTHYVPALTPGTEDQWRALAAGEFSGRVELGDDLLRVTVG